LRDRTQPEHKSQCNSWANWLQADQSQNPETTRELTRVSVQVGNAGTLAANRGPTGIIRAFERSWAVDIQINRARCYFAPLVIVNSHRDVESIDKGHCPIMVVRLKQINKYKFIPSA